MWGQADTFPSLENRGYLWITVFLPAQFQTRTHSAAITSLAELPSEEVTVREKESADLEAARTDLRLACVRPRAIILEERESRLQGLHPLSLWDAAIVNAGATIVTTFPHVGNPERDDVPRQQLPSSACLRGIRMSFRYSFALRYKDSTSRAYWDPYSHPTVHASGSRISVKPALFDFLLGRSVPQEFLRAVLVPWTHHIVADQSQVASDASFARAAYCSAEPLAHHTKDYKSDCSNDHREYFKRVVLLNEAAIVLEFIPIDEICKRLPEGKHFYDANVADFSVAADILPYSALLKRMPMVKFVLNDMLG